MATPVARQPRAGWAEAASELGEPSADEASWQAFGNEDDSDLRW